MADNEFAGSLLYAQWVTAGGTILLNTEFRNFSYNPTIDFIDATSGADPAKRRLNSFKDGQLQINYLAQYDGTQIYTLCAEGTSGTMTWGLAGTATGRPKAVAPFIAMGIVPNEPYNGVVEYSITFQQNGARVDSSW